jgi:magnesium chelatase family protein
MAIQINTACFTGIDGTIVTVEIDISYGLPVFNIVGLADMAVKESKERVRAAIINSGYDFPVSRITINLAPADLKKDGSQFDLPIAVGILLASNQINTKELSEFLILGELSLSGELKAIRGALSIAIESLNNNISKFIIPSENYRECAVLKGSEIYTFQNLKQVVSYLENRDMLPNGQLLYEDKEFNFEVDFEDVIGSESARRAIEVAAAGGHNIIMFGPPGSGKTMLAQRIPTILPRLSYEEALEVTRIYSVSGNLNKEQGLIIERPFRSPHHSSSHAALVGGGRKLMPGEISLAHNGVLFLDEILEFKKDVLEVLRQPLEERQIKLSRANGNVNYPANFMLVAALNPCPCGYYGSGIKECVCSDKDRKRYIGRLSGPLLDRIDIFMFVSTLSYKEISGQKNGEKSENMRARVERARELQSERFKGEKIHSNAEMNQRQIKKYCKLDNKCSKLIELVYNKMQLSNRAYSRILKVARTISDLNGRDSIEDSDIIEALQYRRFLDEKIV